MVIEIISMTRGVGECLDKGTGELSGVMEINDIPRELLVI